MKRVLGVLIVLLCSVCIYAGDFYKGDIEARFSGGFQGLKWILSSDSSLKNVNSALCAEIYSTHLFKVKENLYLGFTEGFDYINGSTLSSKLITKDGTECIGEGLARYEHFIGPTLGFQIKDVSMLEVSIGLDSLGVSSWTDDIYCWGFTSGLGFDFKASRSLGKLFSIMMGLKASCGLGYGINYYPDTKNDLLSLYTLNEFYSSWLANLYCGISINW